MSAHEINVSVELCDPDTGEIQITVEDAANPVDEWTYQDMILRPAVCAALHELLRIYFSKGQSASTTVRLNAPDGAS